VTRTIELTGADVAFRCDDELGEGPVWEPGREALLWVDIIRKLVHVWHPGSGRHVAFATAESVGAVLPRREGGALAAIGQGFCLFDLESGAAEEILDLGLDDATLRLNDAKCDRAGRVWAGTMSETLSPGAATLYRLGADRSLRAVVPGVTVSNGTDWSPGDTEMYYVDTLQHGVDVFDFDAGSGDVARRRRLVDIPKDVGRPDGLTVDADGGIWVALCYGGALHRYTPAGELDTVVRLPVTMVTSCAFGGPDLRDLYVTTGLTTLGDAERAAQTLAGSVFCFTPGVSGLPATPSAA
jgi:sugar lactone lactonase YvrE